MSNNEQDKLKMSDELISFVLTKDELASILHILSFSKEVFSQMAADMHKVGNEKASTVYVARSQLSDHLYNKFDAINEIGEPTSKQVH